MTTAIWRHPTNTPVAQVHTITVTADSTDNDEVWTLTLTLSDGTTATVSYTEDGSPTTTEIATGLYDAWVASSNPFIKQITCTNPSAGVIAFTAATAGVPFSIALTNTGDGTSSPVATTANVGNTDYGTARDWTTDAAPASSDNVVIPAGNVDLLYGMNQSGVSIGAFSVQTGYTGKIGRFENGLPFYLRIAPTSFSYYGSGQRGMFDLGSAAIPLTIDAQGSAVSGYRQIYIKGSALTTVEVSRGNVGIAANYGETSTVSKVSIPEPPSQGSANVYIGSGTTLTTLDQASGSVEMRCAATTATCGAKGTLVTDGSGAITTMNVYGTVVSNSSGTITTANVYGTLDMSQDRTTRTITTLNVFPGARVILGSWVTLTNGVVPGGSSGGTFTIEWKK